MLIRLSLLIAISSALLACGSAKEPQTYAPLFEDGFRTNLAGGSWWSPCFQVMGIGGTILKRRIQFFKDLTYITTTSYYEDSCKMPQYVITEKGTYFLPFTSDEAKPIDLTMNEVLISPRKGYVNEAFNKSAFCGITEWKINKDHPVTGLNCSGTTYPAAGTTTYDLFLVTTNPTPGFSYGQLRFGDTSGANNGTTSVLRPVDIETDGFYYTK
ncbi:MAG: hypothetical protein KF789_04765 [Bdellovibrionaceae bacterium]|nr:hypothetical protein [Pseudobdellovibrionaceae bacterium]